MDKEKAVVKENEPKVDEKKTLDSPNYVEIATQKGWKPFSEYNGPVSSWVAAEEFVKREPLFDKIKSQSKDLREMHETLDAMSAHFKKNVEVQVQQKVDELKVQRDEAIELGDVKKVHTLDTQIQTEEKKTVTETKKKQPQIDPAIQGFIDENSWYKENKEMRDFATAYARSQVQNNGGDLNSALEKTGELVRKTFPEQFTNKRRNAPSAVGGRTLQTGGDTANDVSALNAEQRLVYDQMVTRTKILTPEEYFDGLKEIGEL